ncbi:MAG: hypothetical protein IT446_07655 [Phycisphaerales bacterium]|nr:hypothetical protein [Phycisphaerales bacterium]
MARFRGAMARFRLAMARFRVPMARFRLAMARFGVPMARFCRAVARFRVPMARFGLSIAPTKLGVIQPKRQGVDKNGCFMQSLRGMGSSGNRMSMGIGKFAYRARLIQW